MLIGLSVLIVVCRDLPWIFPGHLIHEDGSILFQSLYQRTAWWDVLIQYAGYTSVGPNVLAAVLMELPLALIPAAFSLASAIVYCSCASVWFLPRFRALVASDRIRFFSCLAICAAPVGNAILIHTLMYSFWPWILASAWLSAVPESTGSRRGEIAGLVFIAIGIVSCPITSLLAPVWVANMVRFKSPLLRWGHAALIAVSVGYLSTIEISASGDDLGYEGGVHLGYALRELIPVIGDRVVFETLFTNWLRIHLIWSGMGFVTFLMGALVVIALGFVAMRYPGERLRFSLSHLALLYVVGALTFTALATRFGPAPIDPYQFYHHRYFFVQQSIFLVGALGIVFSRDFAIGSGRLIATAFVIYVLFATTLDWQEWSLDETPVAPHAVSHFMDELDACERGEETCSPPITLDKLPPGWSWDVEILVSQRWPSFRSY